MQEERASRFLLERPRKPGRVEREEQLTLKRMARQLDRRLEAPEGKRQFWIKHGFIDPDPE